MSIIANPPEKEKPGKPPHPADIIDATRQVREMTSALFLPGDIVEIRRLPSKRSTWHRADKLADVVGELVRENFQGENIYGGANPRIAIGETENTGVELARSLFADVDHADYTEAERRRIGAGLPEPTWTGDSGHGVHYYWRLMEPMADLEEWRAAQKKIIAALNSDKGIHDPARIMRLPGFWNVKREPAVMCKAIRCLPACRFDLVADLLEILPKDKPKQKSAEPVGDAIYDGERNNILTSLAGTMRRRDFGEAAILAALLAENKARCKPPLSDTEVRKIAWSVMRYPSDEKPTPPMVIATPRPEIPWRPFPIDALPPVMGNFAVAVGKSKCVDPVMAVLPMLSVTGACLGNVARAKMRNDYTAPTVIWSAIICRSGEKKSPVFRAVMAPLFDAQESAAEKHAHEMAEYKTALAKWEGKPKKDRGDAPVEPEFPHLLLSDTTTEAAAVRLDKQRQCPIGPRGLIIYNDELNSLFAGMGQYKKGGGNDRETYLAFYDAGLAKIDRKTSTPPTIWIRRAFIAITGGIQPGVLARSFGVGEYESGLAPRFLLAAPPPMQAKWTAHGIPDPFRIAWNNLIVGLLSIPCPEQPHLIPPDAAAMALWEEAHDRLEADRFKEPDDRMRAARAKLIGVIPRLSLIFAMVSAATDRPDAATLQTIDELSMRRAIRVSEWFIHETARVYGMLAEYASDAGSGDDAIVKMIADEFGGVIKPSDLCRRHPSRFHRAGAAEAFLDGLCSDRICRSAYADMGKSGGRPSKIYILLGTQNADTTPGESENGVSALSTPQAGEFSPVDESAEFVPVEGETVELSDADQDALRDDYEREERAALQEPEM